MPMVTVEGKRFFKYGEDYSFMVTKKHLKGVLSGMTTKEKTNVEFREGMVYTTFYGASYMVVKVERIN